MRKSLFFFLSLFCFSISSCSQSDNQPLNNETDSEPTAADNPDENQQGNTAWELVFEEEFDQGFSRWNIWNSGAFNEEIQFYRGEQIQLTDGLLEISIQREAVTGPALPGDATPKDFEYVSGRIESKMQFAPANFEGQREYRFVARIKLPAGHGMWPAFWTYGDPWPTQGEIDILEFRGGETQEYISNIFYGPDPGININSNTVAEHNIGIDLTADFHIYEMVWKANMIEIYFDEELIHTYRANGSNNISRFFGRKQKIVLNTAVGGLFFEDRNSANYADSATMLVDWVRVYRR
ncbi:Glycosyl hydrolases family 16 [Robiginitalea myxolifaciens]|uniref:Glycosyl hydrolases family 16 n=1 Tax=Robiginitalea myxolifaciens TaxID=400055 RepID=A0A1I6HCJ5_9FLAO|nr:glycoside hydrolase family 16 protein [Robiginitalea myxolifaciens]SFR52192.1 Glycosyl hydrolases family 16 [Robiginitalea myxolifaciens]